LSTVLHWHGDTFDLPAGSRLLASSPQYRNQAFAVGKNILAIQFHPEVTAAGTERWFVGHACEIAGAGNLSVDGLRVDSRNHAPAVVKALRKFLKQWLANPG